MELDTRGFGRVMLEASQVSGGPSQGGAAVGFRPESLTILFGDQGAPDRESTATVADVVYHGDLTHYDVWLDGASKPVRLSMRNVFGRPVLSTGVRTRIAWSPGSLRLFR